MKRFPARSPTAHVQSGFLSASWGELISSGPGTHRHLFNPARDQAFLASASGRSADLFFVPVRPKTIVVAVGSQCAAIGGDILDYAGCRASTGSPRTETPALPAPRFCPAPQPVIREAPSPSEYAAFGAEGVGFGRRPFCFCRRLRPKI